MGETPFRVPCCFALGTEFNIKFKTFADLEGGWCGLSCALAAEIRQECRNRPRVCYVFLRRDDAETAPGCRVPSAGRHASRAGEEGMRSRGGTAAASRSAVNHALGLHGLHEAFSLVCVFDEEACSQVCEKDVIEGLGEGLSSELGRGGA